MERGCIVRIRYLVTTLSICIALGVGGQARADDYEDALTAAKRREFATALRLWTPLAEQGNAGAQFNIGLIYDNGRGVEQGRR